MINSSTFGFVLAPLLYVKAVGVSTTEISITSEADPAILEAETVYEVLLEVAEGVPVIAQVTEFILSPAGKEGADVQAVGVPPPPVKAGVIVLIASDFPNT